MDRISWISFDCYGTLVDWETGIWKALEPLVARSSKRPSFVELLRTYGTVESELEKTYRPYREVLRLAVKELAKALEVELQAQEEDLLLRSLPSWKPFPEVNEVLRHLKSRGFRLAILSNIDVDLLESTLKHFSVNFDLLITAEEAKAYKPDLRVFRLFLEKAGARPDQVLHVAQSTFHDIVPAKALGIPNCWVRRPDRDPFGATPAAEAHPDFVISNLKELLELKPLSKGLP